jgi:hypothetical protein
MEGSESFRHKVSTILGAAHAYVGLYNIEYSYQLVQPQLLSTD